MGLRLRLLGFLFFLAMTKLVAQGIADPCFYSLPIAQNFPASGDITGAPLGTADGIKYQNGSWEGTSGTGVSIAPPIECDVVNAVFLRNSGGEAQGVGFRLNGSLAAGNPVSLECTYVSHGTGSAATFSPAVYSAFGPELYTPEGTIQGIFIGNLPAVGNAWTTNTYTFTPFAAQNGHQWIFIIPQTSSGVLMNFCQMSAGELDLDLGPDIELCEGESVTLGNNAWAGAGLTWSTGATSPTINVSSSAYIIITGANDCNSSSGNVQVTVYEPPFIFPDVSDTTICAGEVLELSTIGFNTINTWPDGSIDSLFQITEPGIYQVSITDNCTTLIDEITVDLDDIPVIELGPDTALCQGETLVLDATADFEQIEYAWNTGATSPSITVSGDESATYSVLVANQCGVAEDSRYVEYSLEPLEVLAGEYEICFGIPFLLDVSRFEGTYEWQNGSTAPTFQVPNIGPYWVTIEDDDDCWTVTDTTWVREIICSCPLFIPNSFSPNNDGLNDVFLPVFDCDPFDYRLDIYDRWGRIIDSLEKPEEAWAGIVDGEALPAGIYHYHLFYREDFKGQPINKFGHISLMRRDRN